MTDESVDELEGEKFPDFPLKYRRLNRKCAETTDRTIRHVAFQNESIEKIDPEVKDQQPFHHRSDLRHHAITRVIGFAVVISVGHAHVAEGLPRHCPDRNGQVKKLSPRNVSRVLVNALNMRRWLTQKVAAASGFHKLGAAAARAGRVSTYPLVVDTLGQLPAIGRVALL